MGGEVPLISREDLVPSISCQVGIQVHVLDVVELEAKLGNDHPLQGRERSLVQLLWMWVWGERIRTSIHRSKMTLSNLW